MNKQGMLAELDIYVDIKRTVLCPKLKGPANTTSCFFTFENFCHRLITSTPRVKHQQGLDTLQVPMLPKSNDLPSFHDYGPLNAGRIVSTNSQKVCFRSSLNIKDVYFKQNPHPINPKTTEGIIMCLSGCGCLLDPQCVCV